MTTTLTGVRVSPVNMNERKELGLKAGDTVRVHQKIVDPKGKARIQVFEGVVLARKHGNEPGATFTVRKVSSGIGVEKIFPLYSPNIDKIEIVRRAKVRRAKLYYIREKVAREIKRQMRRMQLTDIATESETEVAARAEAEAKQAEEDAQKAEEEAKAAEEAAEQAEKAAAPEAEESSEEPKAEESTEEGTESSQLSDSGESKTKEDKETAEAAEESDKAEEETESEEEKKS